MNYTQLLIGIKSQRRLPTIVLAGIIGVSLTALTNFLKGLPVSDTAEQTLINWVEGAI